MKNAVFSLLAVAAAANAGKIVSTVFETEVKTITSCAPAVTDCPAHHSTIVHTYTSECEEETSKPYPTSTQVYTSEATTKAYTVSTVYETKMYTITSCAPTVTNCPVGHVTTTVKESTTLCPVEETGVPHPPYPYPSGGHNGTYPHPPPPSPPKDTNTPYPPGGSPIPPPVLSTVTIETCVPTVITKVVTITAEGPKPTGPAGCPGGYNCPPPVVTEGPKPTGTGGAVVPTGAYTTKPIDFAGSASTQRAGGLLLAVGLAAIALF